MSRASVPACATRRRLPGGITTKRERAAPRVRAERPMREGAAQRSAISPRVCCIGVHQGAGGRARGAVVAFPGAASCGAHFRARGRHPRRSSRFLPCPQGDHGADEMEEDEAPEEGAGQPHEVAVEVEEEEEEEELTKEERRALREQQKAEKLKSDELRESQNAGIEQDMDALIQKRLDFIAQQTDLLMHFDNKAKPAAGAGEGKSKRGRMTEKAEDELLMKRAETEASGNSVFADDQRLSKQPSVLQNGTLRDYQLEGLNWMVRS